MKYIVKRELPGAKVGDILTEMSGDGSLAVETPFTTYSVVHRSAKKPALDQGFIEPYEEKPKFEIKSHTRYCYGKPPYTSFLINMNSELEDKTAAAVAEALKLFFEWLHDAEAEDIRAIVDGLTLDMYRAMSQARKLVLADNEVSDE